MIDRPHPGAPHDHQPRPPRRIIDAAFEDRALIGPYTTGAVREAVEAALDLLDSGKARVAARGPDGKWTVNQWLKKAVLLSFRLNDMTPIAGGPGGAAWWDKVPSKFAGWGEDAVPQAPASAPCRTASCAARPTSRRAWC